MDQYLTFDRHYPLEQKLGVIRTLQHTANTIPTEKMAREAQEHHIKKALCKCGYPRWTFVKAPGDLREKINCCLSENP